MHHSSVFGPDFIHRCVGLLGQCRTGTSELNVLTVHKPRSSCSSLSPNSYLSFLCFHYLPPISSLPLCHFSHSLFLPVISHLSLMYLCLVRSPPALLADLFLQLHIPSMFSFILFSRCCLVSIFSLVLSLLSNF